MKKVLARRKDIVFYLKLLPLKVHPDAYWKSKSIACSKSVKLLEENFEKKRIPRNDCTTMEIDNNMKLGEKYGITGTPTIILPDGSVYSGFTAADKLIKIIDGASPKNVAAANRK
jgi:thiol:disulfide interchange protein DsbC